MIAGESGGRKMTEQMRLNSDERQRAVRAVLAIQTVLEAGDFSPREARGALIATVVGSFCNLTLDEELAWIDFYADQMRKMAIETAKVGGET